MTTRVGIIGCGVAGRARAKAVHLHPQTTLVGVHRGRFASDLDAPVMDGDALLAACDVVIVASPSETHADWVARALAAGCHVIVEYPVAATAVQGRDLAARASAAQRVLHVEHIELLAPTTLWMSQHVDTHGWSRGSMRFRSPGAAFEDGAAHAWHQVSRLHRIVAVLGWPDEADVNACDGGELDVDFRWAGGRELWFHAERGSSDVRGLHWRVEGPGGVARVEGRAASLHGTPVTLPATRLFYDDLDVALRRIAGADDAYVSDATVFAVLELAAALGKGVRSGVCVKAP